MEIVLIPVNLDGIETVGQIIELISNYQRSELVAVYRKVQRLNGVQLGDPKQYSTVIAQGESYQTWRGMNAASRDSFVSDAVLYHFSHLVTEVQNG